jgi:hypothetical protein
MPLLAGYRERRCRQQPVVQYKSVVGELAVQTVAVGQGLPLELKLTARLAVTC